MAPRGAAARQLRPPLPAAGQCQPRPDQLQSAEWGLERHCAQEGDSPSPKECEADRCGLVRTQDTYIHIASYFYGVCII